MGPQAGRLVPFLPGSPIPWTIPRNGTTGNQFSAKAYPDLWHWCATLLILPQLYNYFYLVLLNVVKLWMGFPVDWAYFCSLSKCLLFLLHLPLLVFAKQHILSLLALTHICTVEHLNDGFTPRFEIRLTTVAESWMRFFSAVTSKGEAHEVYKVFNVAMVSCAKYKLPEVCHYHLLHLQTSNTIKKWAHQTS